MSKKDFGFLPLSENALAKGGQKGYNIPDGADQVRCVGGVFTCAGAKELALLSTAVVLVPDNIIIYMYVYIKAVK